VTARFKFRHVPIALMAATPKLPPPQVEVIDCQQVPTPPDAELWTYLGAPVQLPASPVPEADWNVWWDDFENTHQWRLQGTRQMRKSPDWQWVEIT
jgi:hypothetical protein